MKTNIYSINGEKKSQIELPIQFSEEIRKDLIKRAVHAVQNNSRQPYGSDPLAGTRQGEATPKRRRKYRTTYGYGISRIKRKFMWHRGSRFGFVGAFVANAVGGKKAFPPSADRDFSQKINKKEKRFAIRSAISATAIKDLILERNHCVDKVNEFPIIIESKLESLSKTKDVINIFNKLNLKDELERISKKKIKSGLSTMRGRKYKVKKGPLFVVSKKCSLQKAARNVIGTEVELVSNLNAELLAPGTQPGRLVIWSEDAIKELNEKRLFL